MPKSFVKHLALIFLLASLLFLAFIDTSFAQTGDTTPPTTTYIMTPSSPNGNNDWYVTPVDFELNATDLESGVKEINYRVDGGTWQKTSFTNTGNLAPNPSFEISDTGTSTGAASWEATVIDPEVTINPTTADYAPGYDVTSLYMNTTGGSWHGFNNKGAYAPASPYENMSASVWMKITGVSGISYFKVYALLSNGSSVELKQSGSITGTTGWTFISTSFTVSNANAVGVYLDIGHTGPGALYADAVSINSSTFVTKTTFSVSRDSENHTVEFYSVDNSGNIETYSCASPVKNCVEFKLDQTPPGNWRDSAAVRGIGPSDHELYVFTTVDDLISGLSTNTNKNMYKIEPTDNFGHFENLTQCNSAWIEDWLALEDAVTVDGTTTATLKTQKIDFCNSDWKVCKDVRFYAEDVAGNSTTKDLCIYGPWIRATGGIVRANANIDMVAEAPDADNTNGLLEAGGNQINFFTTSTGWKVINSDIPPAYGYQELYDSTSETKTTINQTGNLVSSTGVYIVNGNYEITNTKTPNNYNTATFDQIVFINGNLTISNPTKVSASSTALFVVSGNAYIDEKISELGIAIIANGDINTAYNLEEGKTTQALTLNGLYVGNKVLLSRTLQGNRNEAFPSEDFVYEPKYLVQLKQFFNNSQVSWSYVQ
jgi:hypothetical protein